MQRPHTTRVLEVPGRRLRVVPWGNTVDPITPGLMDRPYVARELIPWGGPRRSRPAQRVRPPDPGGRRRTRPASPRSRGAWASATVDAAQRHPVRALQPRAPAAISRRDFDARARAQRREDVRDAALHGPDRRHRFVDEARARARRRTSRRRAASRSTPVDDPTPIVRAESAQRAAHGRRRRRRARRRGRRRSARRRRRRRLLGVVREATRPRCATRSAPTACSCVTDSNRKRGAALEHGARQHRLHRAGRARSRSSTIPATRGSTCSRTRGDDAFTMTEQQGVRVGSGDRVRQPDHLHARGPRRRCAFDGDVDTAWTPPRSTTRSATGSSVDTRRSRSPPTTSTWCSS